MNIAKTGWPLKAAAIFAIIFGVLTLFSGGQVLFFDGEARTAAGNYVPFVLWFNFLAGFAYIIAGIGLLMGRQYAKKLAMLIAIATIIAFAAFGIHIFTGGLYENRTVGAMVLRSAVWIIISLIAAAAWKKHGHNQKTG